MTSPTVEGGGRPDVVLIGPEWPIRALLRAQLLEEGYDVVATDGWPLPRQYLRPEGMPRLVIVDLHGLPEPRRVLAALRTLFDPGRAQPVRRLRTPGAFSVRPRPPTSSSHCESRTSSRSSAPAKGGGSIAFADLTGPSPAFVGVLQQEVEAVNPWLDP